MQQLKSVAKKCAKLLKSISANCFDTVKKFCKNVKTYVLLNIAKFFKRSPRALAAVLTVVLVLSCTATVVLATGTTTAYSVVYDGETIATVKTPSILAEAEIFAANKVNNPECNSHLIKTNLSETIATEKSLITSKELAERIIEHSKDIVIASVLKIDDEIVATGKTNKEISSSVDSYLLTHKQENGLENIEITNEIKVENIYLLKSRVSSLPFIKNYLASGENALSLQAVSTVVVEEEIPFETVETKSNSVLIGKKKVTKEGTNGLKEVTYKVYSLNGVETERVALSETVITEPVNKEVTVGTKREVVADKNPNTSMCWPLKRVGGAYVSSYVGDGRGHKGMDLVSPAGTPIYAATGGTVTFSGWDTSGYGYKIVIKHTGGYETLYAHCSALYVKKGDVVTMGETIGAVGTTGRSTGNHLHFEVHLNGCIKDPVNYIGRK